MFLKKNEFCLYIERKKRELKFDTYMETVLWYIENEADVDVDYDNVSKSLNRKIKEAIEIEASQRNMLKEKMEFVELV